MIAGGATTARSEVHVVDVPRLAVSGREAAELVGLGWRTWQKLDAAGEVPQAVTIGRSRRWIVSELERWLRAGAPLRPRWECLERK